MTNLLLTFAKRFKKRGYYISLTNGKRKISQVLIFDKSIKISRNSVKLV